MFKEKEFRDEQREESGGGLIRVRKDKFKWEAGFPREQPTLGFWVEAEMKMLGEERLLIGGKNYSWGGGGHEERQR